ncbi:protein BIG GRAIN 1-like [Curcuma longa]|uniref:protein BIG GRAIN 1-like n=1 Tax=Curcuma longa TaxID=136217 RepID=UPI003D9E2FE7
MGERRVRGNYKAGHQNPSFSSTLLDAIYRSIDESDGNAAALGSVSTRDRCCASVGIKKKDPLTLLPPVAAASQRAASRCRTLPRICTSSSSDMSSYGGFSSSSDPDCVAARLRPIRTAAAPLCSAPLPLPLAGEGDKKKKKKSGSIRGKLHEMRCSRSAAPASPGARLAGFLGSLLSAVSGTPRKQSPSSSTTAAGGCDDSACSTASSHSRSCLIKNPSTRERAADRGKRTVRFYPVSVIVDEDLRPCGQKSIFEADSSSRRLSATALEARRRVEELLRGMEEEEEEMSDSSSDLFELENLMATENGGAGGGGRMDELPVYETTRLNSFSQSQRFLKI